MLVTRGWLDKYYRPRLDPVQIYSPTVVPVEVRTLSGSFQVCQQLPAESRV